MDEWQIGNPFPGISTATEGMNDPLTAADGSELGPVAASRRLHAEVPPSKHRAGRHKKADPKRQKRDRTRNLRAAIRKSLDERALREAVNG